MSAVPYHVVKYAFDQDRSDEKNLFITIDYQKIQRFQAYVDLLKTYEMQSEDVKFCFSSDIMIDRCLLILDANTSHDMEKFCVDLSQVPAKDIEWLIRTKLSEFLTKVEKTKTVVRELTHNGTTTDSIFKALKEHPKNVFARMLEDEIGYGTRRVDLPHFYYSTFSAIEL